MHVHTYHAYASLIDRLRRRATAYHRYYDQGLYVTYTVTSAGIQVVSLSREPKENN